MPSTCPFEMAEIEEVPQYTYRVAFLVFWAYLVFVKTYSRHFNYFANMAESSAIKPLCHRLAASRA